jgi:hypothetical protein
VRGRQVAGWLAVRTRHLALAGLVAGLLLGGGPAALAAAAALTLAGGALRAGPACSAAALALLAGAALGDARLAAIDGAALPPAHRAIDADATLLEAPRPRPDGSLHARVRFEPGGVAVAVLRPPDGVRVPQLGSVVHVRGTAGPLARSDGYQHLRGARATVQVSALADTGRRRGGLAGALDAARRCA